MEKKLELIIKSLYENLATDIVAIDMKLISPMFDTFVICSADNQRLLHALADHVEEDLEKNNYFLKTKEGSKESQWLLLDFGDIIVHIFTPEERELYHLEKLWGDQHRIDLSELLDNEL